MKRIVFLRADVKGIEAALTRIAIALENAVGITPPGPEAADTDRSIEVSTSSESDLIRDEWAAALGEEIDVAEERPTTLIESFRDLVKPKGRS